MQFRVVIPEHVRSGQYIKVHCPPDGKGSEGREAELRVPKGLKPGDSFVFDISDKDSSITIASDVTNLNSQIAAANSNAKNKANKNSGSSTTSSGGTSGSGGNFLDREVLHLRDFLVALGIGLIIGISIVVGFVVGVLSVTSGMNDDDYHEAMGGGEAANPSVGVYQLQSIKDGLHRPQHHHQEL